MLFLLQCHVNPAAVLISTNVKHSFTIERENQIENTNENLQLNDAAAEQGCEVRCFLGNSVTFRTKKKISFMWTGIGNESKEQQDKVNTADSAFIFLIIQSQS